MRGGTGDPFLPLLQKKEGEEKEGRATGLKKKQKTGRLLKQDRKDKQKKTERSREPGVFDLKS